MKLNKFIREACIQLRLALPVLWSYLTRASVDLVALVYVGHLGKHFLAAAGIATVTANVTGFSMLVGFAGALSTLSGWARGAGDRDALGLALQRALVILPLCICAPVTALWMHSEGLMVALGQEPAIAALAHEYLMYSIPGLWFRAIGLCLQNWLHSQGYMSAIAYVNTMVAVANVGICHLLVITLGLGFDGASIAISIGRFLEAVMLAAYLVCGIRNTILRDVDFQWSARCLYDWGPFIKLAVPNLFMMMEWWASEVIIFLAGVLPVAMAVTGAPSADSAAVALATASAHELDVSAMSIYQNLLGIAYKLTSCLRVVTTTRVSNELGANRPNRARNAANVSLTLALSIGSVVAVVILAFPGVWGKAFTSDREVQALVASLSHIMALYAFADAGQAALTGVVMGTGRQITGGSIVIVAYYLIGLPISYMLAFGTPAEDRNSSNSGGGGGSTGMNILNAQLPRWGLGVHGLCIGTTVGTWSHFLMYATLAWCCINWRAECAKAAQRLADTHKTTVVVRSANGAQRGAGGSAAAIASSADRDKELDWQKGATTRNVMYTRIGGAGGADHMETMNGDDEEHGLAGNGDVRNSNKKPKRRGRTMRRADEVDDDDDDEDEDGGIAGIGDFAMDEEDGDGLLDWDDWDFGLEALGMGAGDSGSGNYSSGPRRDASGQYTNNRSGAGTALYGNVRDTLHTLSDTLFNTNHRAKAAHSQQYEMVKNHTRAIGVDGIRGRGGGSGSGSGSGSGGWMGRWNGTSTRGAGGSGTSTSLAQADNNNNGRTSGSGGSSHSSIVSTSITGSGDEDDDFFDDDEFEFEFEKSGSL